MAEAPAFATATDLATRLKVPLWTDQALVQVDQLLADASAHLRTVIGWQVWPAAEVTTRLTAPAGGPTRLPGAPVAEITAVAVGGMTLPDGSYALVDGELLPSRALPAGTVVSYLVGYADPPRELVSWTCVLASQALSALEDLGSLGGGGVATIAVGEVRKSWHNSADAAGFALPARVEDKLRAAYGSGDAVVTAVR